MCHHISTGLYKVISATRCILQLHVDIMKTQLHSIYTDQQKVLSVEITGREADVTIPL